MARSLITTRLITACENHYGTPPDKLAKRRYVVGIAVRQQLNQMTDDERAALEAITTEEWTKALYLGSTSFGFNAEACLSQATNAWFLQPHTKPLTKA